MSVLSSSRFSLRSLFGFLPLVALAVPTLFYAAPGPTLRGGFGSGSEGMGTGLRVIGLIGKGLTASSQVQPASNGLLLGPATSLYYGPLPFLPEDLSEPFGDTGVTRELAFFLGAHPDNPSSGDGSSIWSRLPLLADASGEWTFSYERFVDWADYFALHVAYTHDLDGTWQPVPAADLSMDPTQTGSSPSTEIVTARLDPELYPAPVYLRLELVPLESN